MNIKSELLRVLQAGREKRQHLTFAVAAGVLLLAAGCSDNGSVSVSAVPTAVAAEPVSSAKEMSFSPYVDEQGSISFPEDFRISMVHMGSWFAPEGGASGFHDVYTERATVEAYRKTGKFPDGATLVKELRASAAADYTTGANVSHSTPALKQWFVMVKDSTGRFEGNPLWGKGWGWALFKPDDPAKNVAANYETDCLGCHLPAQDKDWVYTEAYPILSE